LLEFFTRLETLLQFLGLKIYGKSNYMLNSQCKFQDYKHLHVIRFQWENSTNNLGNKLLFFFFFFVNLSFNDLL
jgi:hypothetical protein